jgi:hypothetical protein
MISPSDSTYHSALLACGFIRADDGTFIAPTDSVVTLAPIGAFFELRIVLGDGNAVIAVLFKTAIKVTRVGVKI